MKITSLIAGSLLPAVFAVPAVNYKAYQQRGSRNSGFSKRGLAASSAFVPARIALKQSNVEEAENLILEISDPDSPKYGQHLSAQEIQDLFAPSEKSIKDVMDWLIGSGVPGDSIKLSPSKGWIHFNTTAGELSSLLKTEYHQYTARGSSKTFFGTEDYSLSSEISAIVDFVHPRTGFSRMEKRSKPGRLLKIATDPIDPNSLETCDTNITPKCIAAQYGIPKARLAQKGNEMGIYEQDPDVYAQEDIDQFFAAMSPEIPKGTGPIVYNLNGGHAPGPPSGAGDESNLDLEMAIPIIYPQKTNFYEMGDINNDSFDIFLDAFIGPYWHDNGDDKNSTVVCNKLKQPNTLSISWGSYENPDEVPIEKRQCTEWMTFGLAGTSVFVASGDSGVEYGQCLGPPRDIFVPDQTCACPYITAVGATYLPKGAKVGDTEIAPENFSSGGGFSNMFPRPAWQNDAVAAYLAKYVPNYKSYNITDAKLPKEPGQGIYNRGGRAYPDISVVGDHGVMVSRGKTFLNSGTSMSCPIVAAMFIRINEERIHIGKKPLGFLSPALYKAYSKGIFTDIVIGDQGKNSPACGTKKGFVASPGWDPVTGLGTPKYDKKLEYFKWL